MQGDAGEGQETADPFRAVPVFLCPARADGSGRSGCLYGTCLSGKAVSGGGYGEVSPACAAAVGGLPGCHGRMRGSRAFRVCEKGGERMRGDRGILLYWYWKLFYF